MIPRPPPSTPFPYTTLFRSPRSPPRSRPGRSWSASCSAPAWGSSPACTPRAAPRDSTPSPPCDTRHDRSEEHTSELQSHSDLVCRLLLEKKKKKDDQ